CGYLRTGRGTAERPASRPPARGSRPEVRYDSPAFARGGGSLVQPNLADWQGKDLIDSSGEKIGKLQDVYVDVETDEPMFGTVKEGFIGRHLTFVPLPGVTTGPDYLQVAVSAEAVKAAPNIELHGDELSQA